MATTTYTTKGGTVYTAPRNPGSAKLASGGFGAGTVIKQTTSSGTATAVVSKSGSLTNLSGTSLTVKPVSALPTEAAKMATAGQSLYGKLDTALGGWLPGGPESPSALSQSIALKAAGATGAIAAGYGLYTLADQTLFGGKLPLGAKNTSTGKKRIRRYDYFNMKALRRADKRIDGFIKHSKKFVSSTGYKLVRR